MTPIPLFTISALIAAHAPAKTGALTLVAKPPVGHHFNLKAPMRMEMADKKTVKPTRAAKGDVRFNVANARPPLPFKITLYVCDDANTYCIKQEQDVEWDGSELRKKSPIDKFSTVNNSKTIALTRVPQRERSRARTDRFGFYLNAPAAARAKAETVLPGDTDVRTHRDINALKALEKSLAGEKPAS